MTTIDVLRPRNTAFAETGAHIGLAPMPEHGLFIVTCMDGRVDPAHLLGLAPGDAIVYRNAGGRVTDEVVREVAFVQHLTETMLGADAPAIEVAIIHHTGCGSGMLTDGGFTGGLARLLGGSESDLAALAVVDPAQTVLDDVETLRTAAWKADRVSVSGHVYDIETGQISTVVDAG